jgi:hypothetical protein
MKLHLRSKERIKIRYHVKKAFTLLILLSAIVRIEAQNSKNTDNNYLQLGLKAGAVNTKINDLGKMLVSESYYTGYTFENTSQWGFTGGVYLNYKLKGSISAIYSEISYSRLANKLHYSDIYDFNYDFLVKYNYFNLEIWYKAYILSGLSLGTGPRIGFNLSPGDIYYNSNGEAKFGPDIRIQQQMRDVLTGRTNFYLGVSACYEFDFGMSLDVRYYYGITDVIETRVNNFHFIENHNNSQILQFTIGYAIPYKMSFF